MNDDRTDLAAQASRRALARAAAKWERNIQNTVRYSELAPTRFARWWQD
jgi:hypothetical protein